MCFGSKDEAHEEQQPAPRPHPRPSSIDKGASTSKKKAPMAPYQDPPSPTTAGPSSSIPYPQQNSYAPPSGASPSKSQPYQDPPSGVATSSQPPPTDLPPSYGDANPQHDWAAAVPDTSLFPPPPAIFSGFERSPSSNASEEEAIAGEVWCEDNPMTAPMMLDDASKGALHFHNIRLMEPAGFNGTLQWKGPGEWKATTRKNSPDRCLISYPPLYAVHEHGPLRTGAPRTIYYEVRILAASPTTYVGLGFTALPYPSFRMPGWHRGSLAVHGDDGHKYINDRWGGKAFTQPFRRGETYGIGMTVKPAEAGRLLVDVFCTRNGSLAGGWNIHEETDAEEDLPVDGLEGHHDLCAAVGVYDGVEIEAVFAPERWMYRDL
ncbi:uncharacterized protein J7T54_004357 [Emericellopsis cladophorae]|uniref:SPRY domain-containing protein n=1 Tax=Emericellopsis cladophorae TaxID=2686198 RepID=A0A9P9Y5D4_9HYPO|nr:uncharacterized protein J7T54_004357 [Emericellopsis cladophorae]KAI6783330.1 hypothetical protein J7T54_004357 [Emericellopsis cladophorae]